MMRVSVVNGSPRGEKSNTHVMLKALAQGFIDNGHQVTVWNLSEKKIGYCTGCYSCWRKTPGVCVQNDDMQAVLSSFVGSDIVIFGSPMYFNNISGTLKVFIDRLTVVGGDPHTTNHQQGKVIQYIMVSNCGFPIPQQFEVISLWINHFCKLTQTSLLEEFYTTNGNALTAPTEEQKQSRTNYINFLRECGSDLARDGKLSAPNKAQARKSILEF
jgi:multimeric flavodoxin WrbA